MAMRRTTSLLLLVLLQASIGLVHSDEARESSIIRAAESSEQDKHNPMFKLNKLTSKDGQSPRTMKELESMLDTTLDGQIFHPLTNMQPSHPDVVTHAYADTKPDNIVRLPIGVPTSIFCLFQNQGPSPLTLTHVAGSLNAPATFRVHFQNFTVEPLLFVVPPGEEVTVQYDFTPKTFLRPGAFQVAHTIFYEGEGDDDMFSTTFFNQSILVVAPTDMLHIYRMDVHNDVQFTCVKGTGSETSGKMTIDGNGIDKITTTTATTTPTTTMSTTSPTNSSSSSVSSHNLDGGEEGTVREEGGGEAGAGGAAGKGGGNPAFSAANTTVGMRSSNSSLTSGGRSAKHQMTLDAAVLEIEARFLLNLPEEELASVERLFFQLEQAHWYYEDFLADAYPECLPHFELEGFTRALFTRSECLQHLQEGHADLVKAFNSYKYAVPVYGCVCLNPEQDKVLLVCNWGGDSWGFPKGKINEGEAPAECAAREVEEETGYDVRPLLREEDSFTMVQNAKKLHFYIIQDVPETFRFEPQVRKEVSEIKFWPLDDLPGNSNRGLTRCLAHVRHWQERKKKKKNEKKGGGKKQKKQQQPMQRASSVGRKGRGGEARAQSAPGGRKGGRDGEKEAQADVNNLTTFGAGDAGSDWNVNAMFAANEKLTGRKFTYDGNPQKFGDNVQQQQLQQEGGGQERERAASTSAVMLSSGKGVVARRLEEIEGRHTSTATASSSPSSPSTTAYLAPSVASLLGFSQSATATKVASAPVVYSCWDLERRASAGSVGEATAKGERKGEGGNGGVGMEFTFDTQDILSALDF